MASKALNFKMEESEILTMKEVANVFNMSLTDYVKNAIREYTEELKKDTFYRLTANVREASAEESAEVLSEIESMSDDDLSISSSESFSL